MWRSDSCPLAIIWWASSSSATARTPSSPVSRGWSTAPWMSRRADQLHPDNWKLEHANGTAFGVESDVPTSRSWVLLWLIRAFLIKCRSLG